MCPRFSLKTRSARPPTLPPRSAQAARQGASSLSAPARWPPVARRGRLVDARAEGGRKQFSASCGNGDGGGGGTNGAAARRPPASITKPPSQLPRLEGARERERDDLSPPRPFRAHRRANKNHCAMAAAAAERMRQGESERSGARPRNGAEQSAAESAAPVRHPIGLLSQSGPRSSASDCVRQPEAAGLSRRRRRRASDFVSTRRRSHR